MNRLAVAALFCTLPILAAGYWPTGGWREATPESQGLDSRVLAEALDHIRDQQLPVHSLLIVRHGYVVLDAYFHPYRRGIVHDAASVTKSITSILAGIAIDKGYLTDVKTPVLALLSAAAPSQHDPRKGRLAIEHLLTMTSGLDCGFQKGEVELAQMRRSQDWPAFVLDLPMRFEPGERFGYCSCNHHVLSALLSARTGGSALEFGQRYLFAPLGIREVAWPSDPNGRNHGWGDLHLHPRDLAKIGYLFLHQGKWEDKPVVSEDWVRQSITPHVKVGSGVDYGYSWWIYKDRQPPVFEALGRGGQRISVLPDKDMIVVFTGGGFEPGEIAPFIFRAIRSDRPLADNPADWERLRQKLQAAQLAPAPRSHAKLPKLAKSISDKLYVLGSNPMDLRSISLAFRDQREARVRIGLGNEDWTFPVGLDGRYRISPGGPLGPQLAAMGEWRSNREFVLDLNSIANINRYLLSMHFAGARVDLNINEATGEIKDLQVTARLVAAQ